MACSKKVTIMELNKSLDMCEHIVAVVRDVHSHITGITPRTTRLTAAKLAKRVMREGPSFLTKTLPRLGRALDQGLTTGKLSNCEGFRKIPDTQLPKLMGELFTRVFSSDGRILPDPCVKSIESLRNVLYCFYKYELPYSKEIEHEVLSSFTKTDGDLRKYNNVCDRLDPARGNFLLPDFDTASDKCCRGVGCNAGICPERGGKQLQHIIINARRALSELFRGFDHRDIYPCHGPGAVSTKEKGPYKYRWRKVSQKLIDCFPLDEYFYSSLTEVSDYLHEIRNMEIGEDSAKVVLVPKDSRKPRLISEEPLVYQWIQQGLRRELYDLVERHPLTRMNVHFTDQTPNKIGALKGSLDFVFQWSESEGREIRLPLTSGKYATLDLKEASDRVTCGAIRALFPPHVVDWAMAARSMKTTLPDGSELELEKFAPMGSALCFPFLALTIWAILRGAGFDEEAKGSFLVYGDDVVVPSAQAEYAISVLESFGLLVNRDKSCIQGFFRESCGTDAFKGHVVTPIRLRKVWTSARCPDTLEAWASYENSYFNRGYTITAELIARKLERVYGDLPRKDDMLSVPSLCSIPDKAPVIRSRWNPDYQRVEYRVWSLKPKKETYELSGWKSLLKYFSLKGRPSVHDACRLQSHADALKALNGPAQSSVSMYTKRRTNTLVRKWVAKQMPTTGVLEELPFNTEVDMDVY